MTVQNVGNPIIHKVGINPGNETRKAKTRLDEILEEKEERAAKRYGAAEMEKMAIEAENEASRLRGEPPKHKYYGGGDVDENKQNEEKEKQRQQLLGFATQFIENGGDPRVAGQILLGLPYVSTPNIPATQGMGLDDVLKIVNLVSDKKETGELRSLITSLDKKIEELAKKPQGGGEGDRKPFDPVSFAKQQAEAVVAWNKALKELAPERPPAVGGEPLEVVKEKNRHDEKMEEIKTERDYKERITSIASEIPERVGRGIAGQAGQRVDDDGEDSGLISMNCECGHKILVPPGATTVTCGNCGAIYQRESTVEAK